MVFGARTVGRRSVSGCRPLSVPSPPTAISPSMPSVLSRDVDEIELVLPVRIDVVARGADERAALGRIELRDLLKEGIQVHVRHLGVEQAIEALDESVDLDLQLIGAYDRAVNGGVERRSVASRGEDPDPFHRD